jgi:hypothetical protein
MADNRSSHTSQVFSTFVFIWLTMMSMIAATKNLFADTIFHVCACLWYGTSGNATSM